MSRFRRRALCAPAFLRQITATIRGKANSLPFLSLAPLPLALFSSLFFFGVCFDCLVPPSPVRHLRPDNLGDDYRRFAAARRYQLIIPTGLYLIYLVKLLNDIRGNTGPVSLLLYSGRK